MSTKIPPPDVSKNLIGQRLRMEMKRRGITSVELSRRADVKTSFIYDIISGKSTNPSTVKLARVAETLGVNLAYLVGNTDTLSEGKDHAQSGEDYVSVPRVIAEVSAVGSTVVTIEQEAERYCFRRSWIREHLGVTPDDLRMLYVRGDSMEPTLYHNDIVLVDTTKKTPSPPGIFTLFDGYGLVVKRLEYARDAEHVRIISDNAQYTTYERSTEDTVVIGRVVWFAREV